MLCLGSMQSVSRAFDRCLVADRCLRHLNIHSVLLMLQVLLDGHCKAHLQLAQNNDGADFRYTV